MSDSPDALVQQIAALEATLKLPLPDSVIHFTEQHLATLRQQHAALIDGRGATTGAMTVGDVAGEDVVKGTTNVSGTVTGAAVGVNQGTVQLFFDGQPGEDGQQLLVAYLERLVEDCQRLRLHRLTGKRQDGNQRTGAADHLRLQDVYTSLTTDGPAHQRAAGRWSVARVRRFLEHLERSVRTPATVVPERILTPIMRVADEPQGGDGLEIRAGALDERTGFASLPDACMVEVRVVRPELTFEAIRTERRLLLLGEPGAGKSTVLRSVALLLAQRVRGVPTPIPGWPADDTPVPVVVPLGQVAAALYAGAADAYAALLQVIGDVLEARVRGGLRRFLTPALRAGGLLLLCDGLDEVSATAAEGRTPPRVAVAAALRQLARETNARIVVTSRVLPYHAPGDWKLLPEDGWALRTVQPLAFGQTRVFVQSWYAALALTDPDLGGATATAHAQDLITELAETERLHPLVRSPLLLTMLALLHYNTGDVPRDRAKLYEECVLLLLDRWEPERQVGMPRAASLSERLGLPSLDPLRQVVHELAYHAHLQPPGDDGRGLIGVEPLTLRMFTFFKRVGTLAEAEAKVQRFLTMLNNEDSGLLQRRSDGGYAVPHLTFQEYLAACHLADQPRMAAIAYQRWGEADRERWREALLLLMGRLHQQGKAEEKGLPWLKLLSGAKVGKVPKADSQRRQDAVLAALSYAELRERGAFAGSMLDIEAELEVPLGAAICFLLATPDAAMSTTDRFAAAAVLGLLGDPRLPVTAEQWQVEWARRTTIFGEPPGYWCYVRGGAYRIGGWAVEEPEATIALPAFWLARYPITVAQYAPFVAEGYGSDAECWWTKAGWQWKQVRGRTEPWGWNYPGYNGANQPVIGITWYEASAYCAWLNAQVPRTDYELRLPTEAEWEAAAAYDAHMQRQMYPWGGEEPTPERAIYGVNKRHRPAPVGCCPSGAAACGALDLAGNVWEWTTSSYQGYPAQSVTQGNGFPTSEWDVPLRGGGYGDDETQIRCGVRKRSLPISVREDSYGVRVCAAPRRT